jgi:hypothetical protein
MESDSEDEGIEFKHIDVTDRVHIVPLGYEHVRITKPAIEMRADKVYLIHHEGDDPEDYPDYYNDIKTELREEGIEVDDSREADIFDLYEALGEIAQVIRENEEHEVYVNLTSGGKVTAIAGMIACMVTGSGKPFYVRATKYGQNTSEPVARNATSISELPTYPIEAPTQEELLLLEFISEEGPVSKGECIEFGEAHGIEPLDKSQDKDRRGLYRLLDTRLLDPLEDRCHIEIEKRGRKKYIEVTDEGGKTLNAFSYMLD